MKDNFQMRRYKRKIFLDLELTQKGIEVGEKDRFFF